MGNKTLLIVSKYNNLEKMINSRNHCSIAIGLIRIIQKIQGIQRLKDAIEMTEKLSFDFERLDNPLEEIFRDHIDLEDRGLRTSNRNNPNYLVIALHGNNSEGKCSISKTDDNYGEWKDLSLPLKDIATHILEGEGIIELVIILTCHGFSISNQLLEDCGNICKAWGPNEPNLSNIENAVDNFVKYLRNEMDGGE